MKPTGIGRGYAGKSRAHTPAPDHPYVCASRCELARHTSASVNRHTALNVHCAAEQRAAAKGWQELYEAGQRALQNRPPLRGCP
jgi:hypothetical protein